jgi:hypothetical protein
MQSNSRSAKASAVAEALAAPRAAGRQRLRTVSTP